MRPAMAVAHPEPISARPDLLPLARKVRTPARSFLRQTFQCLVVLVLATASSFVITHFFFQSMRVVGLSMVPTLYDFQPYLLNHWIYRIHPPRHLDSVVLRDPGDNGLLCFQADLTFSYGAMILEECYGI